MGGGGKKSTIWLLFVQRLYADGALRSGNMAASFFLLHSSDNHLHSA